MSMPRWGAVLRPARPEDLPSVLTLLQASKLPVEGVAAAFGRFVVADAEGRMVGAAGIEVYGSVGLLRSVAVAEGYRGRGLGAALTDTVLRRASAEGITDAYLLTETVAEFFAGCGFQRIARSDAPEDIRTSMEFARLCPTTSTLMTRTLAPSS
ncbi:MAG TPA: arsenic resistance N-acetyltransferase ArsN2 [Longimicrobiales bacterium]|nr:arsenic resistance N-acetyltransferase ArsN2 [Longimicrobiales bacterium]